MIQLYFSFLIWYDEKIGLFRQSMKRLENRIPGKLFNPFLKFNSKKDTRVLRSRAQLSLF